jgi:hypothetical protein
VFCDQRVVETIDISMSRAGSRETHYTEDNVSGVQKPHKEHGLDLEAGR